ncbi:hypothetical protein Ancab_029245 [Ancistrocladus abbreviatus]
MAMRNFFNEIKGMKVKDVPERVKPLLSINYLKGAISRAIDNYHAKYIQTDAFDPVYHVCFGGASPPPLSMKNTPRTRRSLIASAVLFLRMPSMAYRGVSRSSFSTWSKVVFCLSPKLLLSNLGSDGSNVLQFPLKCEKVGSSF